MSYYNSFKESDMFKSLSTLIQKGMGFLKSETGGSGDESPPLKALVPPTSPPTYRSPPAPAMKLPEPVAAPRQETKTTADLFMPILGKLEGKKDHTDHLGIFTKAYGLVNDPKNQPSATNANLAAAHKLGYDLSKATPKQSKEIAALRVSEVEKALAKEVPNWDKLSPQGRVLLLDAKYNTGVTYRKLASAIEKHEKAPTEQTLKAVVTQSRRLSGGQPHKGLDNRAAIVLANMGYINNPQDAKKLGLDLTSLA